MRGTGSGGDIARRSACSLESLETHLSAFFIKNSPRDLIDCDTVFADDERIGLPEMLGTEAGASFVYRGHGVADREFYFLPDDWESIQVSDAGIASSAVQLPRFLDDAIHVLHGEGEA